MASRVVPATLETMTRSSPRILLTRDGLARVGLADDSHLDGIVLFFLLGPPAGNTAHRHPADRRCRVRGRRRRRWDRPGPGCRTRNNPGPAAPVAVASYSPPAPTGLPGLRSSMLATSWSDGGEAGFDIRHKTTITVASSMAICAWSAHEGQHFIVRARLDAAGVNQRKGPAVPVRSP